LERPRRFDVFLRKQIRRISMTIRSILAAAILAGGTSVALAEVEVKTPGVKVEAPSGGVELDVNVGSKVAPSDAWIGRAVYSSDDKHLGEVAGIADDGTYVDVGGFLGLGETRVLLSNDQIDTVQDDRIVLTLTEAQAKSLPAADMKAPQ
jgi:hypothetical protein